MTARRDVKIAAVYKRDELPRLEAYGMDYVRWLRVSECLAARGFTVDVVVNLPDGRQRATPRLSYLPYADADWSEYHAIKTFFHAGFASFRAEGVPPHPFVISKLGSVVGPADDTPGVHFFGDERVALYEIQQQICRQSRYVTLLTEPSRALWEHQVGRSDNVLLVPTGVDRDVPPPLRNPYAPFREKIAVYIGNIYTRMQKHVNVEWQRRLNAIGRRLAGRGIRLCFVGVGATEQIDARAVTCLGPVENHQIWDYQYFADVGLVLAQGRVQHNESSKLYYYLRTGLPVVSEVPVPNNHLIEESGLGLVAGYGDDDSIAEMIEAAAGRSWDRAGAIRYIVDNHTWDRRVETYERLLTEQFDCEEAVAGR